MRSMTHYVRSNTPGNNLSYFVFSYFRVCRAFETPPITSVMIPCHLSHHFLIVTTTFCTLLLPASHPRYGPRGPRERPRAPSGKFPLCSALYLLTTHHHHLLPHHRPWRTPTRAKPGRASHLVPRWLRRLDHAHPASNVTRIGPPCHGKCNHHPKSTPLATQSQITINHA